MPQARDAVKKVSNAADKRKESRCVNGIEMEGQLQHHPRDRHHLKGRGSLPPKTWPDFEIPVEILKEDATGYDDCVPPNDEDRKPKGKSIRPLAQAEGDNRGEQQPFVGDRI